MRGGYDQSRGTWASAIRDGLARRVDVFSAFDARTWGKFCIIGSMCMAQSFPYIFIISAIPTIFRERGLELEMFWIFSLPLIPYWLKFIWAPAVDTHGFAALGLRKSWIIPCTFLGALTVAALALIDPSPEAVWLVAGVLVVHAAIMATQDVAVDAYTLENLPERERGVGSGIKVFFEVLGEMLGLAGLMAVYDSYGWACAMPLAGVLLIVFTTPVMIRREPPLPANVQAQRDAGVRPNLKLFFLRRDSALISVLLILGGFANGMLPPMAGAFFIDAGLGVGEIGAVMGATYTAAGLSGAALTGFIVTRFGLRTALWMLALLAGPAFTPFIAMALAGKGSLMTGAVAIFPAMLIMASLHLTFTVSRMDWSSRVQAGTDFSLQGSLYNVGRTLSGVAAGFVTAALGWPGFFIVLAVIVTAVCISYLGIQPQLLRLIAERRGREEGIDPSHAHSDAKAW